MSKKICMLLTNPFNPDNRVLREAKTLVQYGYKVVILCVRDKEKKLPYKEVKDGIIIKRIVDFLPILTRRKKKFENQKEFLRQAIAEKADFYHAHDLDTLLYGWLAARKNNAKLIYDSHEFWRDKSWGDEGHLWYNRIFKIFLRILERLLIKKADAVIVVNKPAAEALKKIYHLKKLPIILPNYINYFPYRHSDKIREVLKLSSSKKIILYSGGIFKNRGLENLVLSLKYLPKDWVLVFLGYGYLKEELIKIAKENNVIDRVKFIPFVPYEKIVEYISSADLGVAPIQNVSFSYYYCTPNKVSEYIMSRIPLAVSNFPEMRKIIKKYRIGETFNPEDPKDIAKTIKDILGNSAKYNLYKQNLEKAAQDINWEKVSRRLLKLYKELDKL